jgi:hypothetical protein
MAVVVMLMTSEPASGSVTARQLVSAPDANRGRYLRFCSGVPSWTSASAPIPVFVPTLARYATAQRASSMFASASSSVVSPAPPCSSGMLQPKKPRRRISATISSGTASSAETRASLGIAVSRTNRRTVSSSAFNLAVSLIIGAVLSAQSDGALDGAHRGHEAWSHFGF